LLWAMWSPLLCPVKITVKEKKLLFLLPCLKNWCVQKPAKQKSPQRLTIPGPCVHELPILCQSLWGFWTSKCNLVLLEQQAIQQLGPNRGVYMEPVAEYQVENKIL
ncbi:hypothetical protein XELAEV_18022657mg, partial [Xenopus laevis]